MCANLNKSKTRT